MATRNERLEDLNARMRDELNEILAHCHASGHMPQAGDACYATYNRIFATLHSRRRANVSIPDDINKMIAQIRAFPIVRKSWDKKIQNMDMRLRDELKDILQYCRSIGYMPYAGTEYYDRWSHIHHLLYVRRRENREIPGDVLALEREIQSLPSQRSFQAKAKKVNAESEKKLLAQRLENLTNIFPRVQILRMMYGTAAFKELVLSEINPVATKIMSETLERALGHLSSGHCPSGARDIEIFLHYIDANADVYDMDAPKKVSCDDLTTEYPLTAVSIRNKQLKTIRRLLYCVGRDIFTAYVRGDVDGMIACLDPKWQKIYKFQCAHNLIGSARVYDLDGEHELDEISVDDLHDTGAFMNRLRKQHFHNNFIEHMTWVDENLPMLKFIEWTYGATVYNYILSHFQDNDILTCLENYITCVINKCESKYRLWHKDMLIKYVLNRISASERDIIRKRYYSQPIPKSSIVHPDNIDNQSVRMNGGDLMNLCQGSLHFHLINLWMNAIISESKDVIKALLTMRFNDFATTYKIPTDDAAVAEFNIAGKWLAQNFGKIR